MCPRKHFVAARRLENRVEVLGQIGAPQDMREYVGLCKLQTIEPLFRKYLPKGGRILEAGCGRGRWVLYLRGLGYDVAGIDLADSDLAAARALDPSVPIERGDVLEAPFPDNSFDAVISLGVVEHFEEGPRRAFAEVRRLLKPQGLFLVTVPTQNLVRYLVANPIRSAADLLRRLSGVRLAFGEYRYSRAEFSRLLRESQFTIIETAPDDFRPPKNMGLYADLPPLRQKGRMWELNVVGRACNAMLSTLSPWLHCSGTLWVCRR